MLSLAALHTSNLSVPVTPESAIGAMSIVNLTRDPGGFVQYHVANREVPMFSRVLACATRCVAGVPGVAGLCIAGVLLCPALNAQQRSSGFDQPDIQGNGLRPSELAKEEARRVLLELRLAETEPVRGLTFEAIVKSTGKKLHLHYMTVLTNGDVSRARVVESGGRYEVAIRLNDDGAVKMASATAKHTGRPVAIILDGSVVADLTVREALRAEVVFSANFTQAEATRIVDGLNKW